MTATTDAIKPGLHFDLPENLYHGHPTSLSVSGAKVLLRSPALYKWQRDHPVHRDVFDYGTAAHAVALGRGMENIYVAPFENWQTKAAREERALARAEGLAPILPADWHAVSAMAEKLRDNTLVMALLSGGEPEVSAFGVDNETGVLRRSRFDYLHDDGLVVDYKTAASAEAGAFAAAAARYGYHQQHAWYLDLLADLDHPARAFVFVVQEKEPPYEVAVYELEPDAVELGRLLNQAALERFRDCTAADLWPGYPAANEITPLSLPGWAYRQEIPA